VAVAATLAAAAQAEGQAGGKGKPGDNAAARAAPKSQDPTGSSGGGDVPAADVSTPPHKPSLTHSPFPNQLLTTLAAQQNMRPEELLQFSLRARHKSNSRARV